MTRRALLWATLSVALLSACSADDTRPSDASRDARSDTTAPVCAPGATQACTCTDGRAGAQSCSDDRARWMSCECDSDVQSADAADVVIGADVVRDVTPPNTCGSVTAAGRCATTTRVERCATSTGDGSAYIASYDCPVGESCRINRLGIAGCVLTAPCVEGDTQCTGSTTIRTCSGGAWVGSTCPRLCVGSPIGDFCGADVSTTTLSGSVAYEYQQPNSARTDWDPTVQTAVAQGFLVLSFRGNDLVDARVTTSGTTTGGRFSILVPSLAQTGDAIVVAAVGADSSGRIAYALASPGFASDGMRATRTAPPDPRLWAWSWDTQTLASPASLSITRALGSGAARRFDYLRYTYAVATSLFGRGGLPLVGWMQYGSAFDCGNCFNSIPTDSFAGLHFDAQVWFTSDSSEEYWADAVTAHELGHWVMASYSAPPAEGGRHVVGGHVFPGMAWSEGFATFFSSDARGDSIYFDKQGGTVFWWDLSSRSYSPGPLWTRPNPAGGLTQLIDENEVAAMLWDLAGTADCTPGASCPRYEAFASRHLAGPAFARGYTRHYWTMLDPYGDPVGAIDTGEPAAYLADYLDSLVCSGFDRAAIDAVTQPATNYPYRSAEALCP